MTEEMHQMLATTNARIDYVVDSRISKHGETPKNRQRNGGGVRAMVGWHLSPNGVCIANFSIR